jgi:TonB family protein
MSVKTFALICLTLMLVPTALAQSPIDIAQRELKDKTLLLRGFPKGSKLKYTAQGEIMDLKPGIWTVDGFLRVDRIEEKGGELRIHGQRITTVYEPKSRTMQAKLYKDKVDLRIPMVDATAIEKILDRVFVRSPERLADVAPKYWKKFLEEGLKDPPKPNTGSEEKPATQRSCEPIKDGVYKVCGGVKPPVPTYRPEPEFSEFARKYGLTGTVTLVGVVDPNGSMRDIEIAKPCGAGFDEQAMEAVSKWRFRPATKDGTPVPVRIAIDVDFHLY